MRHANTGPRPLYIFISKNAREKGRKISNSIISSKEYEEKRMVEDGPASRRCQRMTVLQMAVSTSLSSLLQMAMWMGLPFSLQKVVSLSAVLKKITRPKMKVKGRKFVLGLLSFPKYQFYYFSL